MEQDIETVTKYLPDGWEIAAKNEGALQRARRIKTANDLLHLDMIYLTNAGSYQNTSTMMQFGTGIRLNKEAVRKRFTDSWRWLQWMVYQFCLEHGYMIEKPDWLGERRVLLADASDVALEGSHTSNYRLHCAFDLFGFTRAQTEITTIVKGGERLDRFALRPLDIIVGDRIYGTVAGMLYAESAGAGFVLRLRTNAFILWDESGERIELMPHLRTLRPGESLSMDCFYKDRKGAMYPVRIVASRKDKEASRKAAHKLKVNTRRKRGVAPSPSAMAMSEYLVLATNLPDTTRQIAELYRARWQVEKEFRRLKGLFNFGEPPGKNPDAVKAWFYGKLFVAALFEAMSKGQVFSPL